MNYIPWGRVAFAFATVSLRSEQHPVCLRGCPHLQRAVLRNDHHHNTRIFVVDQHGDSPARLLRLKHRLHQLVRPVSGLDDFATLYLFDGCAPVLARSHEFLLAILERLLRLLKLFHGWPRVPQTSLSVDGIHGAARIPKISPGVADGDRMSTHILKRVRKGDACSGTATHERRCCFGGRRGGRRWHRPPKRWWLGRSMRRLQRRSMVDRRGWRGRQARAHCRLLGALVRSCSEFSPQVHSVPS